jgi:hypothetical protein
MIGNDHEVRWLYRPADFAVVKDTVYLTPASSPSG